MVLGAGGAEKIIELDLNDEEMAALRTSAEHVKKLEEEVDELFKKFA